MYRRISTNSESSIGFIKYVSTGLTLPLMNVKLSESDIIRLRKYSNNDDIDNSSNKRTNGGRKKIVQIMTIPLFALPLIFPPNVLVWKTDPLVSTSSFMKSTVILINPHSDFSSLLIVVFILFLTA